MFTVANPEMIVLARQSRGLSQADLANKIGRSPGLVSKVENGINAATLPIVEDVARVLHYPTKFFFRPEHVRGSDSICFHHRKRQSMPTKLLTMIEGQMYVTTLQVRALLADLDIEASNKWVQIDPDTYGGSPRRVAEVLRGLWHIPSGPIPNMVRVIEAAGGVVVFRHFRTTKLDGMSCWAKGCPPLFFINSEIPVDRARLTLAHELGHLVMHWTPPESDPEQEANEFALEFLAPSEDIAPDLRNLRFAQLPGLKATWGLSMAAIIMAASKRRIIPQSKINSFWVMLSRSGYRTNEPYPLPAESPTILDEAMRIHLEEHDYSIEELASLADVMPDEFGSLYRPRTERLSVLS